MKNDRDIQLLQLTKMINIGLKKYGAKVMKASSSANEILHPPSNILDQDRDTVWCSGEGLPQHLIISLEHIDLHYVNITCIGFLCQHDYETNPKNIEIWISSSNNEEDYIHWADCQLKKKSGTQIVNIDEIPESYKQIKIVIRETFGEFETYLNQVFLYANPVEREELSSEDRIHEWNPTERYEQQSHHSQSQEEESYQKNAAVLTISKNMIVMEDNIELLSRRIEVLEKRVSHTFQSMERNIITKVEDIIDKKLQKQLSQRQILPPPTEEFRGRNDLGASRMSQHEKKIMTLAKQLQKKLRLREKKIRQLKSKDHRY